ncbi:MAG: aminoacyltransferase [Candidatus Eremiobacteraeota bacterium]|nr:aminoacyltransferase [Candidatus Eremiobacteraeota bacterium]
MSRAKPSPLSVEEWIAFDKRYPAPTFFARPAWMKALCSVNPHLKPFPMRVELANQKSFVVPLLSGTARLMRWKQLVGMPLGTYTCFIGDDGSLPNAGECTEIIDVLSRHSDALTLVMWPLLPQPSPQSNQRAAVVTMHETGLIDLRSGAEQALSRVSGISRRMAGQASRRGVTCAHETGQEAVDLYYGVLEKSAKRWALPAPTISKDLISATLKLSAKDAEVWIVRHGENPIAGGVILYGSQEMFFWSAAMLTEFSALRPSNALNFALISAAAQRGVDWYNLGSSEGLPGVARFKRDLGAETRYYPRIECHKPLFAAYKRLGKLFTIAQPVKPAMQP